MSASLGLYRLQMVDSRLDEIRTRLEEIQQTLENDEQLKNAKSYLDEKKSAHKETLQTLKLAEAEVEKQKIKIEQTESNLYSGSVKNPKELQDMQNELASLKRYLVTLEDRQLEAMLAEDASRLDFQQASETLQDVEKNLASQNRDLTEERDILNQEMDRYLTEREATVQPLDPNLLTVYDQLRQQKRGVAIAALTDGACAACGTTLTPAQQQTTRSASQIFNCTTCGRILFGN